MKLHDQHVHSYYSFDSKESMENYFIEAKKQNLDYIAFTDHVDFMAIFSDFKDDLFDYDKYKEEILRLGKKYNIAPLIGVEMGFQKKKLKEIKEFLNRKYDLIILSVHERDAYDFYYKPSFEEHGVEKLLDLYFDYILQALDSDISFDILGHYDYVFRSYYRWYNQYIDVEKYRDVITKIVQKAIQRNVALEINTSAYETIKSFYYIDFFLEIFKENNGKYLVVSSDCHAVNRYRSSLDEIIKHLKEKGIKHLTYFVNREKHLYEI